MGNSVMFFGYCKKDELINFKAELAEHNKIHMECIEKFNTINNRLRDMEKIYEIYINDSRLQEFRNKLNKFNDFEEEETKQQ